MGTQNNTKKQKRDLSISSEEDDTPLKASWPRFVVVQSTTDEPLRINPFVVERSIKGIAGEVSSVKKLRSGSLLIECRTKQQSANLQSAKHFGKNNVKITAHMTLNISKGIIRDRHRCLADINEADIVKELSKQGVTQVKRFTIKKGENIIKTNTHLLHFSLSSLPKSLKVGYFNIAVEHYIPKPLRCFKCQKYGHGSQSCRGSLICYVALNMTIKVHSALNFQNALTATVAIWHLPKIVQSGNLNRK